MAMDPGGVSSYPEGGSTTTVQTRNGRIDTNAAFLALLAREQRALEQRKAAPPPVDVPAALPIARPPAAPVPVAQTSRPNPVVAREANPNEGRVPIYRKMMGGPNAVGGWVNVSPSEPGAVFAGYMPAGYKDGPVKVDDGMSPAAALAEASVANSPAPPKAPPVPMSGGSDFERARMATALDRSNAEIAARRAPRR